MGDRCVVSRGLAFLLERSKGIFVTSRCFRIGNNQTFSSIYDPDPTSHKYSWDSLKSLRDVAKWREEVARAEEWAGNDRRGPRGTRCSSGANPHDGFGRGTDREGGEIVRTTECFDTAWRMRRVSRRNFWWAQGLMHNARLFAAIATIVPRRS